MLCRQPAKLLASFRREVHHHFIEAVDGRVGIPIQSGVNIIRIGFGFSTFTGFVSWLSLFSVGGAADGCGGAVVTFGVTCALAVWEGIRLAGLFLFRRLFLLGGCFLLADLLGHAPKVEQGELHASE